MQELPVNCLFNKGKTGCGGTELVLRGNKNAIIAVPYISLILNKLDANSEHGDRRDEILGFYGAVTREELVEYLSTHSLKKIIVTYDSLPKLMGIIQEIDGGDEKVFSDYFLLVDEWHCLFKYYFFRNNAIRKMLPVARKFKEVTYMTATPIEPEYTLEELRDYPIVEVEWADISDLKVKICQSNTLIDSFLEFTNKVHDRHPCINFHVFVNSVSLIVDILKSFNTEDVKIVCSQNNGENLKKIQMIRPEYTIAQADDTSRYLNLYTSTAFEGCDIHDPDGVSIIISVPYKEQTMLDIKTTVPQICGRIRDSKYSNKLFYFYSNKQENKISFEKYKEKSLLDFEDTKDFILDLNNLKVKNRKKIIELLDTVKGNTTVNPYIYENEQGELFADKNLLMFDIYNFYIVNKVFVTQDSIQNEFKKIKNVIVEYCILKSKKKAAEKLANNKEAKPTYKDLFEEYHTIRENLFFYEINITSSGQPILQVGSEQVAIEQNRPIVKQAYEKLGIELIRELKYDIKKINKEMLQRENLPAETKVIRLLKPKIEFGQQYTIKQLNEILQNISNEYSLPKLKASKLDSYFECDNSSPKIEGKTCRCKTIIKEKIL